MNKTNKTHRPYTREQHVLNHKRRRNALPVFVDPHRIVVHRRTLTALRGIE